MTYARDLGNGQRLLVQNEGDDTQVASSSGDSGQQQNQSTGFNTGGWSKPPELRASLSTWCKMVRARATDHHSYLCRRRRGGRAEHCIQDVDLIRIKRLA